MAIVKILEFAKDGIKSIAGLTLDAGFPREEKPAREWFNYLFNLIFLKLNEIIDEVNQLREDVDAINRRLDAGDVVEDPDSPVVIPPTTNPSVPVTPPASPRIVLFELRLGSTQSFATGAQPTIIAKNANYTNQEVEWAINVNGYDSNGVVIYKNLVQRGQGLVTNGSGELTFTLPPLPSKESFSNPSITKLVYSIAVVGNTYNSDYNGNSTFIENGVALNAGVISAAGRSERSQPKLWSK